MLKFSFRHQLKRWSGHTSAPLPDHEHSLDSFGSEQQDAAVAGSPGAGGLPASGGRVRMRVGVLMALVIILAGVFNVYLLKKWPIANVQAASGSVTIESDPAGANVVSAGQLRGVTPLTVAVEPGEYIFEVVHAGRRRPLKLTVAAGGSAVHYVHFDPALPSAEAGTSGSVPSRSVPRTPKPVAPAGPTAGWLAVRAPIALDVLESGTIVGTSQSPKIMLPVGRHELAFSNAALGFSDRRLVYVKPGETAAISVDLPNAPLSVNALPWAELWVDGKRIGETPIGNHMVRIGAHEILLRHPELGERRQNVTVSLKTPARVSVDMRKQ